MKMAAALPALEHNGMYDIQKRLVDQPDQPLIAVVVLDSSQTLLDHIKNTKTPTLRIMHIEPMLKYDMRQVAVRLLGEAYRERTSEQLELPLFESITQDTNYPFDGGSE